jgi:nucleoside-diphosphate-sugar epimerase
VENNINHLPLGEAGRGLGILGCGWLGLPLAKKLVDAGYHVKGSVTRQEKMGKLQSAGITPYQIKIFTEGVQGDLTSFLSEIETLIIDIPPGLRSDPEADFVGKIGRLINYIEKSAVEQVIFVSSTSVYEDREDFPNYTEEDAPNGSSPAAKQLISAEKMLLKNEHFQTTVIRFGGLIGPGRHPVKYLAGTSGIKNPEAPVNLIAQEDCIEIILKILETRAWGEVFNAAVPDHPTKEEYYLAQARKKGLALPEFDKSGISKGKKISSVKLEGILGFEFGKSL